MSLNTNYVVLFKTPPDKVQVSFLARQVFLHNHMSTLKHKLFENKLSPFADIIPVENPNREGLGFNERPLSKGV